MMDRELSETCRVLFQRWIWEISASSWCYYKNLSDALSPERQNKQLCVYIPCRITYRLRFACASSKIHLNAPPYRSLFVNDRYIKGTHIFHKILGARGTPSATAVLMTNRFRRNPTNCSRPSHYAADGVKCAAPRFLPILVGGAVRWAYVVSSAGWFSLHGTIHSETHNTR